MNVMDKLIKLLELSKSENEHEAAAAAQRAAELMAKHQLAGIDIDAFKAGRDVVSFEAQRLDDEENAPLIKRLQAWEGFLASAVAEGLGGKVWIVGASAECVLRIVGPKGVPEHARYLFMALRREIARWGRRQMKERGESNAWRRAYCAGMVARIHERLLEGRKVGMQGASSTALVAIDATATKLQAWMEENLPSMRQNSIGERAKRPDARTYGYRDGANLDIGDIDRAKLGEGHRQLKGGKS
jgi:hypothetical protein